eukprot:m51a1_g13628 hypothetical protein (150) ;mRNA; f:470-1552
MLDHLGDETTPDAPEKPEEDEQISPPEALKGVDPPIKDFESIVEAMRPITDFNLYGEDEVLLEPSSEFEVVQVIPIFTDLVCKVVMREVIPSSPLIPLEARPIVLIPPEMPKHQLSGKLKIALKKVVDPSLSSSSDSIVSPKEVHDNSQ